MAVPIPIISTKVLLPSYNTVCDLEIRHEKTEEGEVKRTYICWNKKLNKRLKLKKQMYLPGRRDCLFDFENIIGRIGLHTSAFYYPPLFIPDIAQLSAEESCLRGLEGKFICYVPVEKQLEWTSLNGFKIQADGDYLHFSFSENSVVEQRIQNQPMIGPKLAEHLKKVAAAILNGTGLDEAPPAPEENLPPREEDEEDEETGGIGSTLAYIFCFGWLVDCWNCIFYPDPV